MDSLTRDLRAAVRLLATRPGFVAVTVLTLGLGICATTAVFSVFSGVVLRQFPYPQADRVVRIWSSNQELRVGRTNVAPDDALRWHEAAHSFSGITVFDSGTVTLSGAAGEPQRLQGAVASANFFQVLGVDAAVGRTFVAEEGEPGREHVAVLGHDLWQRRFGGDRGIVGGEIEIDGETHEVIGILPAAFEHPQLTYDGAPELWRPLALAADDPLRGQQWTKVVGRLEPGITVARAQAELDALSAQLEREDSSRQRGWRTAVVPLLDSAVGDVRPIFAGVLIVVALVLLVACANVANMMVARGFSRQKEFATRSALGARRGRLIQTALCESLILAGLGGAVGLLLTPAAVRGIRWLFPDFLPRVGWIQVDSRVLFFGIGLTVLTGLLFGLLPAIRTSGVRLGLLLNESASRGATGGRATARSRSLLVVAQLAVSVVLLVAGGLLVRSLARVTQVDPGFEPRGVVTFQVSLPAAEYSEEHQVREFFRQAQERMRAVPGAGAVATVNMLPFTNRYSCRAFVLSGQAVPAEGEGPCADHRSVGGDYFAAMGLRTIEGGVFGAGETRRVAVVNRTMRRGVSGEGSVVGSLIRWIGDEEDEPRWYEIIGVVADVRHRGLGKEPLPEVYVPYAADSAASSSMAFVVRTDQPAASMVGDLQRALWSVDPKLPAFDVRSMRERIASSLWLERLAAVLVAALATLALLLAAVGLYGLVSHGADQRRRELSIRLAVGAVRADLLRLVLRHGLRLTLFGITIGLAAALAVGQMMASVLFGTRPHDPVTLVVVVIALLAASLIASYLPARRASRADPVSGLRD